MTLRSLALLLCLIASVSCKSKGGAPAAGDDGGGGSGGGVDKPPSIEDAANHDAAALQDAPDQPFDLAIP